MSAEVDDPLIGKVLSGRFQILAPLGKGGMGRVYKALQHPLDRIVALKVLNPQYDSSKDPGFERRFLLEASATARLKHPNTITVHDYGRTDDGIFFIAMEYLEGETLGQVLAREKRLSWQRTTVIAGQVARSLREAHKLGLVHRDLKPANIMLLSEGTAGDVVKVLDFGLVKAFTADRAPVEADITQAGVLLGSPLYMAPEQSRNEADARTDIYALGVLMYQTLAGHPPFQSKDSIEVIVKHIKEKPRPIGDLVPGLPPEVAEVVMRCLQKKPADRFQSMDELLDALRLATQSQGLSGIFNDPRGASGAFSGAATLRSPVAGSQSIEVHVVSPEPWETTQVNPLRRAAFRVGAGVALLGLALGGYLAVRATVGRPEVSPAPRPVVTPLTAPLPVEPPPATVVVTFEVQTEPVGATVRRDGQLLGTSPLSFQVRRQGETPARAELEFELDGYEPATLVAQGTLGTVPVKQALKKKAAAPGPAPKPPRPPGPVKAPGDGYKDDPYQ